MRRRDRVPRVPRCSSAPLLPHVARHALRPALNRPAHALPARGAPIMQLSMDEGSGPILY